MRVVLPRTADKDSAISSLKLLLAVAAFACCSPVRAGELSLNHAEQSAQATATAAPESDRIHLGLDRHEENNTPVYTFATPVPPTVQPGEWKAPGVSTPGGWVAEGTAVNVAMDTPAPASTVASLDLPSSRSMATSSDLPDFLACAGVGTLLLSIGWVCVSSRGRQRSSQADHNAEDPRSHRVQRVKMVPFKDIH